MKTIQINNRHYQECDIVMLESLNESDLFLKVNELEFNKRRPLHGIKNLGWKYHHLYILSNDEIKDGDWYYQYNPFSSVIGKCDDKSPFVAKSSRYIWENKGKKIIATTDSSVKYPERFPSFVTLPQIPQSFIEHFIGEYNQGNVINKVSVECYFTHETDGDKFLNFKLNQNNEISIVNKQTEIIQEFIEKHGITEQQLIDGYKQGLELIFENCSKVTKQETLEEAAERLYPFVDELALKKGFICGAKWQAEQVYKDDVIQTLEKGLVLLLKKQEKMYSEEEVSILLDALKYFINRVENGTIKSKTTYKIYKDIVEQFKKK